MRLRRLKQSIGGNEVTQKSVGGSRPMVQAASEKLAGSGAPTLVSRMYAAPALQHFDDSDPRYGGKSDVVENVYLPEPIIPEPPRPGIQQIFNWLFKGTLK